MLADLHLHTRFSDGSDDADTFIEKIQQSGVTAFALTDHDTVDGIEAVANLTPKHIKFIPGVEFSCICPAGKCHILGLGMDAKHDLLKQALLHGEKVRKEKLVKRLAHLRESYGIIFDEKELAYLHAQNRVGKPHLANLLIKRGLATDLTDAIKRYLNLPEGKSDRIPTQDAIRAILAAGGIPVFAHPLGGEGEKTLPEKDFQNLLHALLSYGLRGMECYYSRYDQEKISFLLAEAHKHSLLVSGGSDYHGTNKNIAIAELNTENIPVDVENLTILRHL